MLDDQAREEIRRLLREHTARNTASPKAAREALVRRGIYTPDGRLTPEYGGDAQGKREDQ